MIVIGLTDIFRFNMDKFNIARHMGRYTSNLCIGALVYVLAQIIDFSTQISKKLYESAQRDILEKMAYTDELTGIANRRRCEEEWDRIDIAEQLESYKKELAKCNKANPDLHISAAYGFCSKAEEPGLDAKEIYRKADGRMYECKVAMKCQRTKE